MKKIKKKRRDGLKFHNLNVIFSENKRSRFVFFFFYYKMYKYLLTNRRKSEIKFYFILKYYNRNYVVDCILQ